MSQLNQLIMRIVAENNGSAGTIAIRDEIHRVIGRWLETSELDEYLAEQIERGALHGYSEGCGRMVTLPPLTVIDLPQYTQAKIISTTRRYLEGCPGRRVETLELNNYLIQSIRVSLGRGSRPISPDEINAVLWEHPDFVKPTMHTVAYLPWRRER